jgi:hypothetical protein
MLFEGALKAVERCCGKDISPYEGICMMVALVVSGGRSAYSAARFFSDSILFAICAASWGGVSAAIVGYLAKDIIRFRRRADDGVVLEKWSHALRHEVFIMNFWHWNWLANKIIGREGVLLDYFVAVAINSLVGVKMVGAFGAAGTYLLGRHYMEKRIGAYVMALISVVFGSCIYAAILESWRKEDQYLESGFRDAEKARLEEERDVEEILTEEIVALAGRGAADLEGNPLRSGS